MSEEKQAPRAAVGTTTPQDPIQRRGFFRWLALGWLTFAAATGGFFTVIIRFLYPNVLFEPPQTFKIGFPDEFSPNSFDTGFKKKFNAWVVRDDESIFALSTTCTHLGCTPNWLLTENKFKCPCHGSGFRITGINFKGPRSKTP
ncbi:MAG: menaquinol-cytochrome C reductase iron-sulfur subunit [Candidatus Neomarinimicrobiota bacterium]|nr:MAG: menaquinol-cytochrome C reductase iron-sulfur subunit [Candidatus Neomarinimicrobiota bacterium]